MDPQLGLTFRSLQRQFPPPLRRCCTCAPASGSLRQQGPQLALAGEISSSAALIPALLPAPNVNETNELFVLCDTYRDHVVLGWAWVGVGSEVGVA